MRKSLTSAGFGVALASFLQVAAAAQDEGGAAGSERFDLGNIGVIEIVRSALADWSTLTGYIIGRRSAHV